MADEAIEAKFKVLLDGVDRVLAPEGFRKRGTSWRKTLAGNVALIELQRSQTSTAGAIRLTFNVGVISARLLEAETDLAIGRATSTHAHLRERIGAFLPAREDKWWTLDEQAVPETLLAELGPLLNRAAAFLAQNVSDLQLVDLWRTGTSPGLTEGQRQRHLRTLAPAS